jgi:hypothetical protein
MLWVDCEMYSESDGCDDSLEFNGYSFIAGGVRPMKRCTGIVPASVAAPTSVADWQAAL